MANISCKLNYTLIFNSPRGDKFVTKNESDDSPLIKMSAQHPSIKSPNRILKNRQSGNLPGDFQPNYGPVTADIVSLTIVIAYPVVICVMFIWINLTYI